MEGEDVSIISSSACRPVVVEGAVHSEDIQMAEGGFLKSCLALGKEVHEFVMGTIVEGRHGSYVQLESRDAVG